MIKYGQPFIELNNRADQPVLAVDDWITTMVLRVQPSMLGQSAK